MTPIATRVIVKCNGAFKPVITLTTMQMPTLFEISVDDFWGLPYFYQSQGHVKNFKLQQGQQGKRGRAREGAGAAPLLRRTCLEVTETSIIINTTLRTIMAVEVPSFSSHSFCRRHWRQYAYYAQVGQNTAFQHAGTDFSLSSGFLHM